jgi:hypothetical protein
MRFRVFSRAVLILNDELSSDDWLCPGFSVVNIFLSIFIISPEFLILVPYIVYIFSATLWLKNKGEPKRVHRFLPFD